ncbi:hypothetical protein BJ165DRAFT_864114 [Panaeolus papilionaceus]|nr:hypothetical protein BJ165DRAFT_864114 [Panaeolus papilionaceus]
MARPTLPPYKRIVVTGPVTVRPIEEEDIEEYSCCVLVVGPTGSGKSSFIEALCNEPQNPPLCISKDQLDGVTQKVTFYRLEGVSHISEKPIFLIDTPGFADPKISEIEILDGIKVWREKGEGPRLCYVVRVLYMHPITDVRLPRTRRTCMKIVQSLWGKRNHYRAKVVTTMWDRLAVRSNALAKAEVRFKQIEDYWGKWAELDAQVFRFTNTFQSAMDILDKTCAGPSPPHIWFDSSLSSDNDSKYKDLLVYEALRDRIEGLQQRLIAIDSELDEAYDKGETELLAILTQEKDEILPLLQRFTQEMGVFPHENLIQQQPDAEGDKNMRPIRDSLEALTANTPETPNSYPDMRTNLSGTSSPKCFYRRLSLWVGDLKLHISKFVALQNTDSHTGMQQM